MDQHEIGDAVIDAQAQLADLFGEPRLPLFIMRDRTLDMGAVPQRGRRRMLLQHETLNGPRMRLSTSQTAAGA